MKLLIYSHYFAPGVGGVESIVLSLARGLAELRSPAGASEEAREFDVTVITQTAAQGYDDRSLPFRVVRRPGLLALWRQIREADVVHVAGPALAPMVLAWLSRRPFAVEHHTYQSVCPNGLLIHQPDRAICPNHFLRKEYRECRRCLAAEFGRFASLRMLLQMAPRYFLVKRAVANLAVSAHVLERCAVPRSVLIYHGVEDALAPASENERQNESSETERRETETPVCFAYVGRLVPEKGLPVLLEAVRILSQAGGPFRVRLIGDGPERPHLEAIIRRDHLESLVEITGFLTGAAFAARLEEADVVVMPSVWEETAGLAAIDQLMCGRLVIVSDVGGLGEIAGDAGLKVPPGDARALADAMQRVLLDPSLIAFYGTRARGRALRLFPRERMIAEHARLYRELARSRNTEGLSP